MISAAHSFSYVDSDIPEDMTVDAYRRQRVAATRASRTSRLDRLRRRAFDVTHPAPALRLRVA
jgi:hypothetical protein